MYAHYILNKTNKTWQTFNYTVVNLAMQDNIKEIEDHTSI